MKKRKYSGEVISCLVVLILSSYFGNYAYSDEMYTYGSGSTGTISVDPSELYLNEGKFGTATISWNSNSSIAEVWYSMKEYETILDFDAYEGSFMKDPEFAVIPGPVPYSQPVLFIGDCHGDIRAFRMSIGENHVNYNQEIRLTLPNLNADKHEQRWAPAIAVSHDTVYLYYAKGSNINGNIDWDSFRLYVTKANLNTDLEWNNNGNLLSIKFSNDDQLIDVLNWNSFAYDPRYGIVDPDIFVDNGQIYIYYVVVQYGIPNERYHQSFIRVQRMYDYTTPYGQGDDTAVYDGFADANDGSPDNIDDGIAEAPSVLKIDGKYIMLFSSYPCENPSRPEDGDQRIIAIKSDNPKFAPWTQRVVVMSSNPDVNPYYLAEEDWEIKGTGGQDFICDGQEKYYIFYQGLRREAGTPIYRFGRINMNRFVDYYIKGVEQEIYFESGASGNKKTNFIEAPNKYQFNLYDGTDRQTLLNAATVTAILVPESPPIKYDINNDGLVNIQDVMLCVNVILGTENDEEIIARADVNRDGSVNVLDVMMIVNIILGG